LAQESSGVHLIHTDNEEADNEEATSDLKQLQKYHG